MCWNLKMAKEQFLILVTERANQGDKVTHFQLLIGSVLRPQQTLTWAQAFEVKNFCCSILRTSISKNTRLTKLICWLSNWDAKESEIRLLETIQRHNYRLLVSKGPTSHYCLLMCILATTRHWLIWLLRNLLSLMRWKPELIQLAYSS